MAHIILESLTEAICPSFTQKIPQTITLDKIGKNNASRFFSPVSALPLDTEWLCNPSCFLKHVSVFLKLFILFFFKTQAITPALTAIFIKFYVNLDPIFQNNNIQISAQEGFSQTYTRAFLVIFSGKVTLRILFLVLQSILSESSLISTDDLCNKLKQVNLCKSKIWIRFVPLNSEFIFSQWTKGSA